MNLFYTFNEAFVPQVGASLCSVCENNREAPEICFYLGMLGVGEARQQQLSALAARYGRTVRPIPLDGLRESIGFDFDTLGWNEVVLARLLIGRLLPQDVERVLYLDGDTVVTGSLSGLWNMDMKGCVLAASMEPTANRERRNQLGLEGLPYFNSGVLLFDLARWRKGDCGRRVLEYYRQKGGRLFAPDQDALNGALKGEIIPLEPKYNFCNIYWYYPYRTLRRLQQPAEYFSAPVFEDSCRDPRIIHYLGEDRPWRRGSRHRYLREFEHYLSLTPWKDLPKEKGWELPLFCYRAFRTLLKPFPMLQYRIVDRLIPAVMKYRKRQRTRK